MKTNRQLWTGIFCAFGMLVLILDAKTAVAGAKDGIALCLYTVIPALFPFFILSILISTSLVGSNMKLLRPIGKLCGIPIGAESLLLLGFLGGYPVGAQAVTQAWCDKRLAENEAKRMLGFCSNAGPAFIFGMASSLFSNLTSVWVLWGVHILSALIIGFVLPGKSNRTCEQTSSKSVSVVSALEKSIRIMATVCGWVVIFRVILAYLNRWVLWYVSQETRIGVAGLLELANGCIESIHVSTEGGKFIFTSAFLGFGGACVGAQTISVTRGLGPGMYFPGKLIQGSLSIILACIIQHFLFPLGQRYNIPATIIILLTIFTFGTVLFLHRKKTVAFADKMIYNKLKFIS